MNLASTSSHGQEQQATNKEPTMCPRCKSWDTKFCYNNNKKITQPRYKCNECKRKFTKGGKIRDVPLKHSGSNRNRRKEGFPNVSSRKSRNGKLRKKQSRAYKEESAFSVSEESDDEAYYEEDSEEEHPRKKMKKKDWENFTSSDEEEHLSSLKQQRQRVTKGGTALVSSRDDKIVPGCSSMVWFKPVIDLISKAIRDGCAGIAYDKQDENMSSKRKQQQIVAPAIT